MLMEDKIKRSENFILKCHYMLVIYSFVSWFAWFNKRPLGTWQQTKETCWMNSEYVFPHSLHTMKTEFCWPSDRMSLPFVFVMHQWKKYAFGWKMWKKRILVTFHGQELPVFNAGILQGFAWRILLLLPALGMTMTTYKWRNISCITKILSA